MRNGKVERLWIQNGSGNVGVFNVQKLVLNYQPEGYDEKTPLGPRYIEVISIEDHERVVSELKAEVLQYHRMAASGVWIESKAYNRQIETIAKQARAIDVLKACILKEDHRCGIWHDGRKAIEQAETIERGEA